MTLDEFRQKNPAYKDWPDQKLADGLYNKFYAGKMDRNEFNRQVGYEPTGGVGDFLGGIFGKKGIVAGLRETAAAAGEAEAGNIAGAIGEPPEQTTGGFPEIRQQIAKDMQPTSTAERYGSVIGQAVGNPTSYLGPGGLPLKVASAVTGATGAEWARKQAEGTELETPMAMLGGAVGGGAAALPSAGRAAWRSSTARAAMAGEQGIHDASRAAYKEIEASPIYLDHQQLDDFGRAIHREVAGYPNSFNARTAPTTFGTMADFFAEQQGQRTSLRDILDLHEQLGNVSAQTNYKDFTAAQVARAAIRDEIETALPAESRTMRDALANWSAYKKIEEVQAAQEAAGLRAASTGTAQNFQNVMRQEIRKIFSNPKRRRGYSDEELAQMERIITGPAMENWLRMAGKGLSPASPLGAARTLFIDNLMGTTVAVVSGAAGLVAKHLGDYLTRQEVERLVTLIQERAPVNAATAPASRAARAASRDAWRNARWATGRGAVGAALDNPEQFQ
jgi:hypothetical protein